MHGLKHVPVPTEIKWEHIRFETTTQLNFLKSSIGTYCKMGVAKDVPSKNNIHIVSLTLNGTINTFE